MSEYETQMHAYIVQIPNSWRHMIVTHLERMVPMEGKYSPTHACKRKGKEAEISQPVH
jgi:hypothetical protein